MPLTSAPRLQPVLGKGLRAAWPTQGVSGVPQDPQRSHPVEHPGHLLQIGNAPSRKRPSTSARAFGSAAEPTSAHCVTAPGKGYRLDHGPYVAIMRDGCDGHNLHGGARSPGPLDVPVILTPPCVFP